MENENKETMKKQVSEFDPDLDLDLDEDIGDIESLLKEIEGLEDTPFAETPHTASETRSLVEPDPDEAVPGPFPKAPAPETKDRQAVPETGDRRSAPEKQKKGPLSVLFEWVRIIVFAVVIALLINHFLIANALIPSGSMETTIMTGDRIIGLRTSYWFSKPERGDIVIFKYPDDESKLFIKRVIGLPGDKVEIVEGKVYINDSTEPLAEPYLTVEPKGSFGPYEVPEGSYFMLGDNRNVSKDSRYWDNTFVKEEKIIAKAFFRYYPSFHLIK